MPSVKAVVFDADGTLVSSFELIVAAYRHIATVVGVEPPSTEAINAHLALSTPLHMIMADFFPGKDVGELLRINGEFFDKNHERMPAYEGMRELIEQLHGEGLKLALLTGGGPKVHDILNHHGIGDYFSSVVHSERVVKHKPDPEGFLLALSEIGAEAHETIMVGDSKNDILTGKNGRALTTVGVTHGFGTKEELQAAGADYLIDSLPELITIIARIK